MLVAAYIADVKPALGADGRFQDGGERSVRQIEDGSLAKRVRSFGGKKACGAGIRVCPDQGPVGKLVFSGQSQWCIAFKSGKRAFVAQRDDGVLRHLERCNRAACFFCRRGHLRASSYGEKRAYSGRTDEKLPARERGVLAFGQGNANLFVECVWRLPHFRARGIGRACGCGVAGFESRA